jgi:hypothetical protein
MSTQTFTDVAGHTVTVQRPPDGYLVIADTDGMNFVISKAACRDVAEIGRLILMQADPQMLEGLTTTPANTSSA